ncbi:uncharacterized protein [Choristoneura fumiferana]|uniref:uncharacterized protein n=1 Tax=Choristoneura fumiferana TaxID=7141 RepID=UPI003D15A050
MRTIDPELWSKKVKGRKLELAQPLRFRPGEAGLKARIRGYSYSDAMGEFRRNCSVAAFRNLESQDTGKCERYYWRILLAIFILGAFLVMIFSVVRFMMIQSLQISHTSSQYSLQRMHFPAVALCSYNIISNRGLDILTKELKERDEYRRYSHEDLRNGLLQFGRLQTMALLSPALPIQEQQVGPSLRRLTSQYGFPDYNVSLLMLQLAPSCDSMLVKCAWRGKEMPCDYLFAMRVTSVGYCCVFNSRYEPYDMENPPRVLDREGKDNGLSVIYREDIDDFGLVRRPVHGIEVLIFDGMEYPLLEGGGVRVQRTQPNAVVFFKLRTRTQLASSSLSIFPEFLRGCRMKSGSSQPSYSWCLMECRRRAIEDLCGCVPYTLQPRQDLVCSLDHLLCLNKHRGVVPRELK